MKVLIDLVTKLESASHVSLIFVLHSWKKWGDTMPIQLGFHGPLKWDIKLTNVRSVHECQHYVSILGLGVIPSKEQNNERFEKDELSKPKPLDPTPKPFN